LIITFTPQIPGNAIIVGHKLFEFITNLDLLKYENVSRKIGMFLIVAGQILIIYSIIIKDQQKIFKFSLMGIITLAVALLIIGINNVNSYGNVFLVTAITILPFLCLTLFYLYLEFNKRKHSR
jgi:uncharacterized membrane protein HdeD (DUF308 family)